MWVTLSFFKPVYCVRGSSPSSDTSCGGPVPGTTMCLWRAALDTDGLSRRMGHTTPRDPDTAAHRPLPLNNRWITVTDGGRRFDVFILLFILPCREEPWRVHSVMVRPGGSRNAAAVRSHRSLVCVKRRRAKPKLGGVMSLWCLQRALQSHTKGGARGDKGHCHVKKHSTVMKEKKKFNCYGILYSFSRRLSTKNISLFQSFSNKKVILQSVSL